MKTEIKEINMLNDALFKSLFRSIEARDMVTDFLSSITGIKKEILERAEYQGGELPKKILKEKGKIADIIIKIENGNKIVLEMNQYQSDNIFEKNSSYAFSIISETILSGTKKYPKVILINIDNFNHYNTEKPILDFKIRDEEGHIETEQYHSIHLVLENIVNEKYNIDKEIQKVVELLKTKSIEEMREKFEGEEKYMAAIRRVEELSTDPDFVGYYDIEEARKWDLEDMRETGIKEGIEKGSYQQKIEIAKSMLQEKIPLETIVKCTNLSQKEVEKLV